MESQDAFAAQAEAMADRMRKQAAVSLQKVRCMHRAVWTNQDSMDDKIKLHYVGNAPPPPKMMQAQVTKANAAD